MEWILTAFSIISLILCIYRKKVGFALGSIVNITWFAIDLNYGLYSQAVLFLAYFVLTIWGWFKWLKMEKNNKNIKVINFIWRNQDGESMPVV